MSHIETVNVSITDLEALKDACKAMGVEFVANKKTYNWYGRSVGDYPLPKGFTREELGTCEHVIRVPGVRYEIGLAKARTETGEPVKGFTMLYDFYGRSTAHDGEKLREKFGNGLTKLVDAYSLAALTRKARAKGLTTTTKTVDGKIHLTVRGF